MPQGRRKVPFSTKQKKAQLQQKRARKNVAHHNVDSSRSEIVDSYTRGTSSHFGANVEVLNKQPATSSKQDPNRYSLIFKKEDPSVMKTNMLLSKQPFKALPEYKLEVSFEEVFPPDSELDMPKRPPWDHSMSKSLLEANEEKYFREYIASLENRFKDNLKYFDMNLETWRQLWRVIEFSDIVLLVIDIRYPVFHFSPSLYNYVVKELTKDMIVVFNKIDLVPPPLVVAWQEYFKRNFPKLRIMYFATNAGMKLKEGKQGKRIGKLRMAVKGCRYLVKLCEEIVEQQVDLTSWHEKITEEMLETGAGRGDGFDSDDDDYEEEEEDEEKKGPKISELLTVPNDTSFYQEDRYENGILTIGFVGHPNVGKSSFLNAVLGKKVVSVSRTPGHTKHYQTIMLTPTVRLCDCPGLVFPSLVPKPLQVLMGCYPIAQVREPYSVVSYLCERVPVHMILKLQHPEFDSKHPNEEFEWSAYDVCEAMAKKRGFVTSRAARPDVYRAANCILRMALDGRTLCVAFSPPDYVKNKDMWSNHPDVEKVKAVQAPRPDKNTLQEAAALKMPQEISSESSSCEEGEGDSGDSDSDNSQSISNKFNILSNLT